MDKPVYVSSTASGEPGFVTDGRGNTHWASKSLDNEWIYIDLGSAKEISGVGFSWEYVYAKAFKIQVSNDAEAWTDVYSTEGQPGEQRILFTETNAHYVRMYGVGTTTLWGYSLWNLKYTKVLL